MEKILFICSGNTCRSPMAEGIFRKIANEKRMSVEVLSAGIFARNGLKPQEHAIKAARGKGAFIKDHEAVQMERKILEEADLILTMTRSQKEHILKIVPEMRDKIYMLKEYNIKNGRTSRNEIEECLDINDPYGFELETFLCCADEIETELIKLGEGLGPDMYGNKG